LKSLAVMVESVISNVNVESRMPADALGPGGNTLGESVFSIH